MADDDHARVAFWEPLRSRRNFSPNQRIALRSVPARFRTPVVPTPDVPSQ